MNGNQVGDTRRVRARAIYCRSGWWIKQNTKQQTNKCATLEMQCVKADQHTKTANERKIFNVLFTVVQMKWNVIKSNEMEIMERNNTNINSNSINGQTVYDFFSSSSCASQCNTKPYVNTQFLHRDWNYEIKLGYFILDAFGASSFSSSFVVYLLSNGLLFCRFVAAVVHRISIVE